MKTKQYQGRTREQAIEEARRELGEDMVVMYTKRKRGVFGSTFIVTVGVEDDVPLPDYKEAFETARQEESKPEFTPLSSHFSAVADEEVRIPVLNDAAAESSMEKDEKQEISAEDFRSTFRAVEEVIAQARQENEPSAATYDKRASLVRYKDPADSVEYTRNMPQRKPPKRQYTPPTVRQEAEDEFTIDTPELGDDIIPGAIARAGSKIVRAIYNALLRSEVDERYINQVLAELDPNLLNGASIETALGLVYQKLVLKFGRPKLITVNEKRPKVVFFIGPTGVGKTTTIAKLAADFRFGQKKKVALFTADSYRIAAEKQIAEYGELMKIDVVLLYVEGEDDINEKIAEKYQRYDLILVDTTGFSHKDEEQRESIKRLLDSLSERYDKQVYLVLSATTKYRDLKDIIKVYQSFTDFDLLFTKLDETEAYGNILNSRLYAGTSLSYVTTGQDVPDDFEVIDPQKMVHSLLGGGL